jgi:hypothetical protein
MAGAPYFAAVPAAAVPVFPPQPLIASSTNSMVITLTAMNALREVLLFTSAPPLHRNE